MTTAALVLLSLAATTGRVVAVHRATAVVWLALLGWLAVASVRALDPLHAWIGTPDRRLGWLTWLLFACAYFAGQSLGRDRDALVVARAAACAGIALGVYTLAELLGFAPVDVEFAGLPGVLKQERDKNPNKIVVVIKVHPEAKFHAMVDIIDDLDALKMNRFALAPFDGDPGVVPDPGAQAGQGVEERGLARVRRAEQPEAQGRDLRSESVLGDRRLTHGVFRSGRARTWIRSASLRRRQSWVPRSS